MDWGVLIPITAIVFIFGGGTIKRILDMMERRMEMKMASQDHNTASQIAAIRQELAQLRDTSTQYDISIQHTLEDMQQRLSHLESRRIPAPQSAEGEQIAIKGG